MGAAEKSGASKRGILSCPNASSSTEEDCRVTIQSLGAAAFESLASSPESHKPRMTKPADTSAQCIRPSRRERSAKRAAGISTLRQPFPSHHGRISLRAKPLQTAVSARCPTQAETIRPGLNCFPNDSNDAHILLNKPLAELLKSTTTDQNSILMLANPTAKTELSF